jgi:hypothetical protein
MIPPIGKDRMLYKEILALMIHYCDELASSHCEDDSERDYEAMNRIIKRLEELRKSACKLWGEAL